MNDEEFVNHLTERLETWERQRHEQKWLTQWMPWIALSLGIVIGVLIGTTTTHSTQRGVWCTESYSGSVHGLSYWL